MVGAFPVGSAPAGSGAGNGARGLASCPSPLGAPRVLIAVAARGTVAAPSPLGASALRGIITAFGAYASAPSPLGTPHLFGAAQVRGVTSAPGPLSLAMEILAAAPSLVGWVAARSPLGAPQVRALVRRGVRNHLRAPVALLARNPVAARLCHPAAVSLAVRCVATWGPLRQLAARHLAPVAAPGWVGAAHAVPAALLASNPVRAMHLAPSCDLFGVVQVLSPAPLVVHAAAGTFAPLALRLSADLGSPIWQADIALATPQEYSRINIGDTLTVSVGADAWALVVDEKQRTRPDGYTIKAVSPLACFGSPWAMPQALGLVGLARAGCEDLLGQPIDWRLVDWRLPATAAALEATPLELARQIVAAVGGVIESNPSGTLVARPSDPLSPPTTAAPVVATLTDEHLYSHAESVGAPLIANRYTISSGTSGETAAIQTEVVEDPDDGTHRTVYAYPWPWRAVDLVHTGDDAVTIGPRGEVMRPHEELIAITAGTGAIGYPAAEVDLLDYRYLDLGAVSFGEDGKTITTADPQYSQIQIAFGARAWVWEVYDPRAESIQFLALET